MNSVLTNLRFAFPAVLILGMTAFTTPLASAQDKAIYQNDFSEIAVDEVPDDFLILDGFFAVKEEENNKYLELPGAPLGTFGVLFGTNTQDGVEVSVRIFGTNTKRRFPAFGVGLNGLAGYRLMLAPSKRELELYKGELRVASLRYRWKPGTWTHFRLRSTKSGDAEWKVQGKIWVAGDKEPEMWALQFTDKEKPFAGKASIWGKPFSGTPIRYDDLVIRTVKP